MKWSWGCAQISWHLPYSRGKPQKTSARRPTDEGAVRPVIASNGVPFPQMRSVGSHCTSEREKEEIKDWKASCPWNQVKLREDSLSKTGGRRSSEENKLLWLIIQCYNINIFRRLAGIFLVNKGDISSILLIGSEWERVIIKFGRWLTPVDLWASEGGGTILPRLWSQSRVLFDSWGYNLYLPKEIIWFFECQMYLLWKNCNYKL